MKRSFVISFGIVMCTVLLTSCSTSEEGRKASNKSDKEQSVMEEEEQMETMMVTEDITKEEVMDEISEESNYDDEEADMIQDAIQLEHSVTETAEHTDETDETDETQKTDKTEEAEHAQISESIPVKYLTKRSDHAGTIEHVSYQTYDYFGDQSEITKYAYVYLPDGYDKGTAYNVLYLMHGIGGNEKEWGMYDDSSRVKAMMDNLIYYGDIKPFIVVVPNGRSSADFANTSSDYNSFYLFGKELRNDLIPFIDRTYSTYAEYDENGYDMTAARDHRAMAGLSMGGMQTINIGMCECFDLLSYFGAFSQAPTTYASTKIATLLSGYPDYDINYFYSICGTEDKIAWNSARNSIYQIDTLTDKLVDGTNYMWQEVSGNHDFNVWYLGFYNFAQLVFQDGIEEE